MKFRYYIIDPCEGSVKGTDSESIAHKLVEYDYYVLDSESGESLQPNGVRVPVKEIGE